MLAVVVAVPMPAVARREPANGTPAASDPPHPADRLAGLSLVLRTVLTLQKEGLKRVVVLVARDDEAVVQQLRDDPRVQLELASVTIEPQAGLLAALRDKVSEPFLLARYDVVVDPAVYRQLLAVEDDEVIGWLAAAQGQPFGPLRGTAALLEAVPPQQADAASLQPLVADGRVALIDVGTRWWTSVDTPAGRQRATWHLFEACRKPVDGLVSRHLNRHISLFFSKWLVNTPLSPNGATILTFLIGVGAAAFALQGGYRDTLIGAALFQLNQIFDGVDGELARVRFQQSKLGQWLDTIGDDAALALFYAALAIGAQPLPWGWLWSLCGWIGAATTLLSALLYYSELARLGSGDLYAIEWDFDKKQPEGLAGKALLFFRTIFKQDFFSFVFLCAAAVGLLHQSLPMFAVGGVAIVVAATVRRFRLAFTPVPPGGTRPTSDPHADQRISKK